jgi:transglutaminase-like putative cysteine protease
MIEYTISYTAQNSYAEPVHQAVFELNILPCTDHIQVLTGYSVKNSLNARFALTVNLFGFNTLQFRTKESFTELYIQLAAQVRKRPFTELPPLRSDVLLEDISKNDFYIDHQLFLRPTPLTDITEDNRDKILRMDKRTPVLKFISTMNLYVHQYISYSKGKTTVQTSANDILLTPEGVCQDYTHLLIAMCRYNGIPARYVSGYVYPDNDILGALQMHAWAEVFVPDLGWIGVDPTNNIFVNDYFIKVSHGTDYNDCSPLKGILNTFGTNTTQHDVQVFLGAPPPQQNQSSFFSDQQQQQQQQ